MSELKAAVHAGITGIAARYGAERVRTTADAQGGAWVEILGIAPGPPYLQETTFVVVLLPFALPNADIYPLFVRHDLSRRDGQPLGAGFQVTQLSWPGEPQPRSVVQVSRRTVGNFAIQTPIQKIDKVLEWIRGC